MKRFLVVSIVFTWLIAACMPIQPVGPEGVATPATTPVATPAPDDPGIEAPELDIPENLEAFEENIQEFAADELDIDTDDLRILQIEAVDWSDACLGTPEADEMCAMVITPGFRVVVQVGDHEDAETHVFHTNQDASHIRLGEEDADTAGIDEPSGVTPQAEELAMVIRQMLMQQLHTTFDAVNIEDIEAVDFPDACLGVPNPVELCAQMITPGYRITIEADGESYVYHTDQTGRSIRLAQAPEAEVGDVVIVWTYSHDEGCIEATIGTEGVAFGQCYAIQMQGYFAGEMREDDLAHFSEMYESFEAETAAGFIEFTGQGEQEALEAEQRMIAEWARLVALEADAGRSGASWGLVFAWNREGGIAGFCDYLNVYVTGDVFASRCTDDDTFETVGTDRLEAGQLAQIYEWVDNYGLLESEFTDPGTADAMTTRLIFSGAGTGDAAEIQADIEEFATTLFASLEQSADVDTDE
jgi:hypothetical protein